MRLLLDIGNTRIKWNTSKGLFERQPSSFVSLSDNWLASFASVRADIEHVLICSVRSGDVLREISDTFLREWGIEPFVALSQSHCGRIANGYEEPAKLGVDRWLAVVACGKEEVAGVVVDSGTATTIDVVSADGRHLGGYIVPGLEMMGRTLMGETAGVRFSQGTLPEDLGLGRETGAAVLRGGALMTLSFIERVWKDSRVANEGGKLILTGGAARYLGSFLTIPHTIRPDLVLEGLETVFLEGRS